MKKTLLMAAALTAIGCTQEVTESKYLASDKPNTILYEVDIDQMAITGQTEQVRGTQVATFPIATIKIDGEKYIKTYLNKTTYYVKAGALVDSLKDCIQEKTLFVRTPASILKDTNKIEISGFAGKGEELAIIGYDKMKEDGTIDRYKVQFGNTEGWIYTKYTVDNVEDALYRDPEQDKAHSKVKNSFGGGRANGCDFFPTIKPNYDKMPQPCYCLYLNNGEGILGGIEGYIALAKRTKINAFVIDIKDNERPGYKADAMKKYSPTNYNRASKKGIEIYKHVVDRLHEEGFYVIGRITCFKDTYFVKDNPECAITEIATGEPFFHNKAYWPSAFGRRVWEFNVALACESVKRFGFDEINFDYVRFPDKMTKIEDLIDYHNKYQESKVQAIQRYVTYACDAIHACGAYVSIDVFGECANCGYTTAYGQYWPALSNVADVMSGMPYPDHFTNGYYGVSEPWNHPYEILSAWAQRVRYQQSVTPTPARVRTWVQAYHVMRHVDPNGIDYTAENMAKEIQALFDGGLTGGYMPWHASSTLSRYKEMEGAFNIDYTKTE